MFNYSFWSRFGAKGGKRRSRPPPPYCACSSSHPSLSFFLAAFPTPREAHICTLIECQLSLSSDPFLPYPMMRLFWNCFSLTSRLEGNLSCGFLLLTELCHVLGLLCGCTLRRCPYYFCACWWPPVGPITFCAVLESFHVNASSIASSTRSSITFTSVT